MNCNNKGLNAYVCLNINHSILHLLAEAVPIALFKILVLRKVELQSGLILSYYRVSLLHKERNKIIS